MFKNLDYRTIRALHICIIFTVSIAIEQLLKIPRGAWTAFTVMIIYAGFGTGASIQRMGQRFWGVILGLFLAYIIWFIGHLNYRTLFLMIPVLVFFYYYSLGTLFAYTSIFTVTLSAIGPDYFGSPGFYVSWFFTDYFACTLLAAIICMLFEYFIFAKINMTRRFYIALQKNMITGLSELLALTKPAIIRKSQYIQSTVVFNKKVIEMKTFVKSTKHDYHNKDDLIAELDEFTESMNLAYQNIRRSFVLPVEERFVFQQKTADLIEQLNQLIKTEQAEN